MLSIFATDSSSKCNYLGSLVDNTCVCESIWTGSNCQSLNVVPYVESPTSYTEGIYTPNNPTWCGSIVQGYNEYFALTSTMTNYRGLSCWAYVSTGGIWRSTSINGPWVFVSYIGFGNYSTTNAYVPTDVPWGHNFRFYVEYSLADPTNLDSSRTYALVGYSIMKFNNKEPLQGPLNADFGPPNSSICSDAWAIPFPSTENQQIHVLYKILGQDLSQTLIQQQISSILQQRQLVIGINGFQVTNYVNTGFSWVNLNSKIPGVKPNSVNPAPLVSSEDNYNYLVLMNNNYYRALAYRFNVEYEKIYIVYLPANKFIWQPFVVYTAGPSLPFTWSVEDPFFFKSANGYHMLLHDTKTCSSSSGGNRNNCGSITHLADNVLTSNKWTKPIIIYNSIVENLKYGAQYRQRPGIYFPDSNGNSVLLNGLIWNSVMSTCRTFPVYLEVN